MSYAFRGKRYMTRGVEAKIDPLLQIYLWSMIDSWIDAGYEMDYLQVFSLQATTRGGKPCQRITHSQEQPKRDSLVIVDFIQEPVSTKVYVIDDSDHVTMLLAEEY